MALELQQLRQMLALVQHGSFVRAAKALHVSQPALSRSIKGLEQQLGRSLFLRSASGVVPTDIGRLYIDRARDLVRMADELDRELQERRTIQSGQVAVGGGPYPAELLLGRAAMRFTRQYPGVSLQIIVRNWDEQLRLLRSRELDYFVAEISTLVHDQDIVVEEIGATHPLFFITRCGHPLAGRTDVTAADVFAWPFLSPTRLPPRILEPMLAAQRAATRSGSTSLPLPLLECASFATLMHILEHTDSVTAGPLQFVAGDSERKRYAAVGTEPWLHLRYGLVSLKGRPLTHAAARFKEFVLDAERAFSAEERRLLGKRRASSRRRKSLPADSTGTP